MRLVLFSDLAAATERVRATRSRTAKVAALADCLARLDPEEVESGVAFLSGEPRQTRLGVGYAALRDLEVPPAPEPGLTVSDVDGAFASMAAASGPGSQEERTTLLRNLLAAATGPEQRLIGGLIVREVRQGALEGLLAEAVAEASGAPAEEVRRAVMLAGDLRPVAAAVLRSGPPALTGFALEVFRPLKPMLAQSAPDVVTALERTGPAAVEHKIDGARIQVHRHGGSVGVFTRNLQDATARVPEIVEAVAALDLDSIVLDGEAVALDADSKPLPFQVTMGRFGTERDVETERERVPLSAVFFDCLHLDGEDLLDLPASERFAAMAAAVPSALLVERIETADPEAAGRFLESALRAGQEGVVVKALGAPYAAGRRGAAWVKVKPAHTLDLVVLAAEWGSGRRQGWLSNLHLGATDPAGGFVMLGKTFKGLTDEMLAWQTERFLELETHRKRHVVYVRPEQVVEIAFDGIQDSPRYPGGVALRFARVKGYRADKGPDEADTIDTVLAIHRGERR
jgi:DNA ligase-1